MKKKTIIVLGILAVFGVVLYFAAVGVVRNIESNLAHLVDLPIANVDLSQIEDGTYTGKYESFPLAAEVEVRVADHVITGIELVRHSHGQGEAAEAIPARVVEAQSLEVDVVTGATYSSKVILKAIENALRKTD